MIQLVRDFQSATAMLTAFSSTPGAYYVIRNSRAIIAKISTEAGGEKLNIHFQQGFAGGRVEKRLIRRPPSGNGAFISNFSSKGS